MSNDWNTGLDTQKTAGMIDYTLLKPDATVLQIKELCAEAKKFRFASVCVNLCNVSVCKKELAGTDIKICTVAGFPLGAVTTEIKVFETENAIAMGADELDMVMNLGWLKSGHYDSVENDIRSVVRAAKGKTVKVILEAPLLTDSEIIKACQICKSAGADFVKTCTGFFGRAMVHHVKLMRRESGMDMKVKAAGGIKTFRRLRSMARAGADRIGSSSGVAIIKEMKSRIK